ncbi:MAG: pilus assembly protein [Chloroflexi bacterium]|nr:pilus assembly protein [Chloroflexota bacterium]
MGAALTRVLRFAPCLSGIPRSHAQRGQALRLSSGQAALEMLLVLLILVPLLFGGIELARGVGIRHSLDSGVGVAARAISLDPSQWSWATQVIEDSVTNNVLGGGTASTPTVRAFNDAGTQLNSGQLAALGFGETFRLQAETTYTPWLPLITGGGQGITIRVSHWGIVEKYP